MPTIDQLPLAVVVNAADLVPVEQNGTAMAAPVALLLQTRQPVLTLAPGTLLGRVSTGPGGPEPVGLGAGLALLNGQLVASALGSLPLVSPAFTGVPTAPTPALHDTSNAVATTAFVQAVTQAQTIVLSGDVFGSGVTSAVAATLPAITTPGVYGKVTVNAKGQVIGGGALLASDVSGLARVAVTGSLADLTGTLGPVDLSAATVIGPPGGPGRSLSRRALDMFNVLDFGAVADGLTHAGTAINAAIAAAAALPLGGEVYLPAGHYRIDLSIAALTAKSGVMLRGAGRGKTLLTMDDSIASGAGAAGLSNATSAGVFPPITDFHMRDITLQGMRGQNGSNVGTGAFLVNLTNIGNVSVINCELLDSRNFSLGIFSGSDVLVRGNRVARSNFDSIAVWNVSNAIITDNEIEMSGDDSISVHTSDAALAPLRAGLLIANNSITDGPGIHVLGAKTAVISGNIIRRGRGTGINVGFDPFFQQGDTPNFAIQITGNLIEDVIDNSGFIAGSTPAYYILAGGSSKQSGPGAAAPGLPAAGSGTVVSLFGTGTGTLYANGQSNTDGTHSVTGTTPSPGGYWLRIEGNTLVRTLPAVSAWTQWGYGSALQVGSSGIYSGAVTEAMLNHPGIHLIGALRHSRIAGNIIQTTGSNGIEFDYSVIDMDYDGVEIVGNRIADFGQFGVFWPTGTTSNQRIRIAGNDFDGDPYFRASGRGPNGSWSGSGSPSFGLYLAFLGGVEVEENHFRNLGAVVAQSGGAFGVFRRNVVHCNPAAVGSSPANQGVGTVPSAGPDFTHVIESCDPTSANYGRMISATLASGAAQPTTGIYVTGHFVANSLPSTIAGQVLLGWQRLTTGSTHVAGLDWAVVYGASGVAPPNAALVSGNGTNLTGVSLGGGLALAGGVLTATAPAYPVSNSYAASGAIAVSDALAVITATASVTLTLGSGLVDGHVLTVKRFGSGAATLMATIDGVAGMQIAMGSSSIKEAVTLIWSQSFSSWLII